jgi:hypothetical protein
MWVFNWNGFTTRYVISQNLILPVKSCKYQNVKRNANVLTKLIVTDILVPFSFSTPQHGRLQFFLKMTELLVLFLTLFNIMFLILSCLFVKEIKIKVSACFSEITY